MLRSALRPFFALACACLPLLAGCQQQATSPNGTDIQRVASPSCMPYRSSLAQGPVALWGIGLKGLQPIFPGERLTIMSYGPTSAIPKGGWSSAKSVEFYVVADLKNVMWFGEQKDVRACLSRHGVLWGRTDVKNGTFQFTGSVPERVTEGHTWYVVAVGENGFYYALDLADGTPPDQSMYRLAKPYTLAALPAGALGTPGSAEDVLEPGQLFQLRGKGLRQNGALLVRLGIRSPTFDSDATIGTVRVEGGELHATLELPREPEVLGVGRRSLSPSWSYDLTLWSTNGKMVYYSLPVTLR